MNETETQRKTYTIKPLEWHKSGDSYCTLGNAPLLIQKEASQHWELYAFRDGASGIFTSLKAAKAKARELHESHLTKYLQEVIA